MHKILNKWKDLKLFTIWKDLIEKKNYLVQQIVWFLKQDNNYSLELYIIIIFLIKNNEFSNKSNVIRLKTKIEMNDRKHIEWHINCVTDWQPTAGLQQNSLI